MDKHTLFKFYANYFAKKRFLKFNLFLFHLSVRGLGVLNYYDFKLSGEHFFIKKFLKRLKVRTVFDVGANEGEYAAHFLEEENCKIYGFEPNPNTFEILNKRYKGSSQVQVFNFGLSDEESSTVIYDTQRQDGSRLATVHKGVIDELFHESVQEFPITLRTLDDVVKELGITEIDLLKVDTEGNEYKVLKGATETLKQGIVKIIHFEFNMMNVVSRVYLKDFMDLLKDYNFYRLLPKELVPIDYSRPLVNELFAFQNIIAIRKDIDKDIN